MEKLKRIIAAVLMTTICLSSLTACGKTRQSETYHQRGPLDIQKVTYLVYPGWVNEVDMYVITSDLKGEKYTIYPDANKAYDYLNGELPPEHSDENPYERYEVTEFEIDELQWSSIVNVMTRVNFMELDEDMSTKDLIDDGASYYIRVETSDGVHTSGGYMAGYDDNSDSTRFARAREMVENATKGV